MKQAKTFAQRAKEIEKKFEGRNDKVSLRTKKALMQELRDEQEKVKAQLDAERSPSMSLNDYSDTNQAFFGSLFGGGGGGAAGGAAGGGGAAAGAGGAGAAGAAGGGAGGGIMGAMGGGGGGGGLANTVMDMGKQAFGKPDIDTSGATRPEKITKPGATAASGALKGAQAGMAFGPWGAAAGAVIGGVTGFIGGSKAKKAEEEALANNDQMLANQARPNSYLAAYGGTLPGTDPNKKSSFEPMPKEDSENEVPYERRLEAWGNRMKLSAEQLQGFVDQKNSDNQWTADRDQFYADQFANWRAQKTGQTPNKNFSQTDPEYRKFWDETKANWHKDNPRQINDIVQNYRKNGPAGNGMITSQPEFDPSMGESVGPEGMLAMNENAKGGLIPLKQAFMYGGNVNKAGWGDWFRGNQDTGGQPEEAAWKNIDFNAFNTGKSVEGRYNEDGSAAKSGAGKALEWAGQNAGNIGQYAEAIGALTNKIKRAETPRGTRLEGDVHLDRMDERRLVRELNNNFNVSGAANEGSGGSLALRNALAMKGQLNKGKAISDAYTKMADSNLSQQEKEVQMNERRKFANMQADERFLEREAQDEAAYQTAKQQNRAAIFKNIANVSREEVDKKTVKEMYGYKWNGKYWTDPKGKKVSDGEYLAAIKQHEAQKEQMFGGYLKK